MTILFIHVVKCLRKKDGKTSSSEDTGGTKCNRRLIWTCCFWFNWKVMNSQFFFKIVSMKWVLIDVCYIEPFQMLIKFYGTILITAQPRHKACSICSASLEQISRIQDFIFLCACIVNIIFFNYNQLDATILYIITLSLYIIIIYYLFITKHYTLYIIIYFCILLYFI